VPIDGSREPSLGGWLLVLFLFLAVWQPVNLAMAASTAFAALPVRGWPLGVLLVARIVVTACGVAAAIAMSHRHPGAVLFAKTALAISAGMELFVYTTSYFPNNRLPGDTPWYIAWSIASHGAGLVYLFTSTRVRQMLGDDDVPAAQRLTPQGVGTRRRTGHRDIGD
jgi:hypothetical protein